MHHANLRPLACVVLGFVMGLLWVNPAVAEGVGLQFEPPPTALKCLASQRPEHKRPDYPATALASAKGAIVRVRLHFTAAEQGPRVDVAYNNGDEVFVQAVRAFVADYRLPCLAEAPGVVDAIQEFQFVIKAPDPVVYWNKPRDDLNGIDQLTPECEKSAAAVATANPPLYPARFLREGQTGSVLVRLKFVSTDAAPEVEILYESNKVFTGAVQRAIERYRLPCLAPRGGPVIATQLFTFLLEGMPHSVVKPAVAFPQFAGLISDLSKQHVRFDFNTMGCPFDVKVGLYQPYMRNRVGEVSETDPSRREFVEWLRTVTLNIPTENFKTMIGQEFTVAVPCAVLDLL